ncbi:MAG: WD40 repeat domain-containing protein [Pleurocapsa sp. MO_226.B13]|nr:WD40 repeat domain-containing protein [Pleurocapsa sp. MO_226.B13]
MEQWFNLLIKVAQPILTTLAYTGTNIFLDTIQSEVKNQQKRQTTMALKSLGIKQEKIALAQQVINNSTDLIFELDELENASILSPQHLVDGYSVLNERNFGRQLTQKTERTALNFPESKKSLEYWPLRLLPSQLIHSRLEKQPIPLRIIIAPPHENVPEFKSLGIEVTEIERVLAQNLREFLGQNYSSQCSLRPTEFLGRAWNNHFHGEASIKTLFGVLPTEPTLILETAIENDYIIVRLAYWGSQQKQYCYETLLKLPYRHLLETSIKARAFRWKETKNKLLALGKSPEVITKLGGDNELNLTILEEVAELQAAGIATEELSFTYQVNRQDFTYICQFLSICQCLVAGWVTDIHYLMENNTTPNLSEWLPQMLGESEFLPDTIRASITIYQKVLQVLVKERPNYIPHLSLKLARSLLSLDASLAQEQIDYSWQHWLHQLQLSPISVREGLDIDTIQATFSKSDWIYLIELQTCLSLFDDSARIAHIQEPLARLCDRDSSTYAQRVEHFALDYTVTAISGRVCCLWLDSTNFKLISKSTNKTLDLWQLKRRQVQLTPTHQLRGYSGQAIAVTLSLDGDRLVCSDTTAKRSYLRIWNLQTGKLESTLFGHKQSIQSLAISSGDPKARRQRNRPFLASGSHKIKLWDLQTGEPWLTLFGHKQWVYALAIAPNGKTLVSGSEDKTIRIWHLATGDLIQTLTGHQAAVRVIAIAPDGQTIISGSEDRTIKLWDIETGKLLCTLTGHTGGICTLAIAPNGKTLVSGSEDKTIKIWHFETGEPRQTLSGHEKTVRTLAIHPNGQTIVSGSDDRTIKFWRII